MLSREQVARAQVVCIGDVATERGFALDRRGDHTGPCPHCGGTDRFSICSRKGVFLCRQCQPKGGGGAIALVMFLDGVGFREAVERLIGGAGELTHRAKPKPAAKAARSDYSDSVRRLWQEGVDPCGTLAEKYLRERELALDDDLCGRVLRFHGRCPFKDDAGKVIFVPALLAAFRPFRDDDETKPPQAIHRIGLDRDGNKLGKMMLGSVGGCAVKLDADDMVEQGLGICEGIETGLRVRARGWRPVWALGSAGAIRTFAPIPGIEALTIFADHDEINPTTGKPPGQDAARECAHVWHAAGCEVFIRTPHDVGSDWLDVQS